MTGAIAQDRQRCQFPFLVDEKPTFVPGGSAGDGREVRERFLVAALGSSHELARRYPCFAFDRDFRALGLTVIA